MEKVKVDKQFALGLWDLSKGAFIFVGTLILTLILQQAKEGLGFDWNIIWDAAVSGFVTYLIKNYVSPTKVTIDQPKEYTIEAIKRVVK